MDALRRRKLDRLTAGVIGLLAVGLCAGAYLAFGPSSGRSSGPSARPNRAPAAKPVARASEPSDTLPNVAAQPPAAPSLPFKVRGVIYNAAGGSVVFLERSGKWGLYCVGDRLEGGWTIASIGQESAVFTRDGENVTLNVDRPSFKEASAAFAQSGAAQSASTQPSRVQGIPVAERPGSEGRNMSRSMSVTSSVVPAVPPPDAARNSDATVAVDRSVAELARQDPIQLVQDVQYAPLMKNGQMDGVQLNLVPGNSVAARYGLATGDRIVAVNNQPITSLDQAWNLYNQFRDTNAVNVTIIRAGQRKVVTYYVP